MTTRTFILNDASYTFAELLDVLPNKEFESPARSTLPLLAWWRAERLPLTVMPGDNYTVEVEAQVAAAPRPSGGTNRPSFTDVMIREPSAAIAIEGKWTEPSYPTVSKWLGSSPSANKLGVLDRWLRLIQPFGSVALDRAGVESVTYQMIHRTASACAQGCPNPVVLYQLFGTAHRDRYLGELGLLRDAVEPERLRVLLMVVPMVTTSAWAALGRGEPERVRRALTSQELFEFGEPEVVEV